MKKIILMALAAFTVLAAGTLANPSQAQPENARGVVRELVQELLNFRKEAGLTDAQRTQVKDIMKSHKDEIRTQFMSGRDARRSMRQAVEAGGPESTGAQEAADAIAAVARSRALLIAKITSEIRPILTADQLKLAQTTRERIEEIIDERVAGFAE